MIEAWITLETLRIIWWALLGTLLIGFTLFDGFDLGVVVLLPFVAKTDKERRVVINTVGPVWEGNQVWLILGAGAIFAAFPHVYAVAFSGLYLPMFLVLSAFIFRPVAFKYRSKLEDSVWRTTWDVILFCTGLIPLAGFGLVVGNVLMGLPFGFDDDMRLTYYGGILDLIRPFPVVCCLLSLAMCIRHGASYLLLKTEGVIFWRASRFFYYASWAFLLLFLIGTMFLVGHVPGYFITSPFVTGASSNPLNKTVEVVLGGWTANCYQAPWILLPLFLSVGLGAASPVAVFLKKPLLGFVSSCLSIFCTFTTLGLSLFPFLLPSSFNPDHSLTIWDSSSSHLTLFVMLVAAIIFLPIILTYTSFVYWVFAGKVREDFVEKNSQGLY